MQGSNREQTYNNYGLKEEEILLWTHLPRVVWKNVLIEELPGSSTVSLSKGLREPFPHLPFSRNLPYQYEFQSLFEAKCKSHDVFETFPYLSDGDIFPLNYCSIYFLSAPDWLGENKLFLGTRFCTRLHLIFTTFVWLSSAALFYIVEKLGQRNTHNSCRRNSTTSAISGTPDSVLVIAVCKVWRCSRF